MMKTVLIFLLLFTTSFLNSQPKISIEELLIKAEKNPKIEKQARELASTLKLPINIYIRNTVFIEAKDTENGKVVYSVITNFQHPFKDGYALYFEDIQKKYDLSKARIRYADGKVIDNSGEIIKLHKSSSSKLLLVPDWTNDKVMAFDFQTGDIVDTAFIPPSNPQLQSPKHAIQRSRTRIIVSDQISDVVQEFDTSGAYIRVFAPAGGPNPAILDNIRGIAFKPNGYLLVTVASGTSQNTIQQFDTGGVTAGAFITSNLNSPFAILYRQGDILVTNSSGTEDVNKFTFGGVFINSFISAALNFPQQIIKLTNGDIALAEFSTPGSGIKLYDSTGVLKATLSGITGNRAVFKLQNGNYLTTNGAGIHEIDDTTGALVRTILSAANLQYIDVYDPNYPSGIENSSNMNPGRHYLHNNYPNPFNPSTNIKFEIPQTELVKLSIYDALGREIQTLVNETLSPGIYDVSWDASAYSSGIYFYRLTAGDFVQVRKMSLIK